MGDMEQPPRQETPPPVPEGNAGVTAAAQLPTRVLVPTLGPAHEAQAWHGGPL